MSTQGIAKKITRCAEGLGFTVEQHTSGISESTYLTLWYAPVLAQPLCIRISAHASSPAAIKKHGLADFEIGSHSARCTDMAQCIHWLRSIAGRELPPRLAVSMQHELHCSNSSTLITHGGKHPPYLHYGGLGTKGERLVMLTMQLPASNVLLSDHDEWHMVLNNGPCTDDEAEWDNWNALEKVWPAEQYATAMRASWEKIFDPGRPQWGGCKERRHDYIQACFWVLEKSMVKAERWFTAR